MTLTTSFFLELFYSSFFSFLALIFLRFSPGVSERDGQLKKGSKHVKAGQPASIARAREQRKHKKPSKTPRRGEKRNSAFSRLWGFLFLSGGSRGWVGLGCGWVGFGPVFGSGCISGSFGLGRDLSFGRAGGQSIRIVFGGWAGYVEKTLSTHSPTHPLIPRFMEGKRERGNAVFWDEFLEYWQEKENEMKMQKAPFSILG